MGYVLEFRAGNIAQVETLLSDGVVPDEIEDAGSAGLVANAIRAGEPALLRPDVSAYVVEVIQASSWWWGSIQHSSSGGPTFRGEITEELAALFGRDFVVNLINRPLLELHTDDHPMIGWVRNEEIKFAYNRATTRGLPVAEDQTELTRTLIPILERAIEHDLDLWGLYI